METKYFQRRVSNLQYGGYWQVIKVVSDGEIIPDLEWEETDSTRSDVTVYQCQNPSSCVDDYMEAQRKIDELNTRVHELRAEQDVLSKIIASRMPAYMPVLFRNCVVVMDEEGKLEFQKFVKPEDI